MPYDPANSLSKNSNLTKRQKDLSVVLVWIVILSILSSILANINHPKHYQRTMKDSHRRPENSLSSCIRVSTETLKIHIHPCLLQDIALVASRQNLNHLILYRCQQVYIQTPRMPGINNYSHESVLTKNRIQCCECTKTKRERKPERLR